MMLPLTLVLESPLFTDWQKQLVYLELEGVAVDTPLALTIDSEPAPFQYTGAQRRNGAEVLVHLGFAAGEKKELVFTPCPAASTDRTPVERVLTEGAAIGLPRRELAIPAPAATGSGIAGPFARFGPFPFESRIHCDAAFEGAALTRTNTGPLYEEYDLEYRFAGGRVYRLTLRCYRDLPYIEVGEAYGLRRGSALCWTLNPEGYFDAILSRDSFEGEKGPTIEPLGEEHPRDLLCRLQMPVLSEYFIPNNRGWFAFLHRDRPDQEMLGILGLYGAKWQQPVEGMPEVRDAQARCAWHASLESGARHWLLTATPVETEATPERRLLFHRLHGEFNALRLDEHLDLAGQACYDEDLPSRPGFFDTPDMRVGVPARREALAALQEALDGGDAWSKQNRGGHRCTLEAFLDPSSENHRAVYTWLVERFALWVRQFQGWRRGQNDYMKNVIGFTRWLRGMLLAYELLRRDGALTPEETGRLNAYFVFAARRITDFGRWPHERTALHPDHPESTRDLYTYGGEHRADRLYWTNCLPNFQSDPLCALAHLAAVFPSHPDAEAWQRLALDDLDNQLDAYCGRSGAWVESINYALYTLSYFVITFHALKGHRGIDYFHDERVRRMVGWLTRFFGPLDKRWGRHTFPAIGNACLPTGGGEYLLCFAAGLHEADPLRAACIAVYQRQEGNRVPGEHYPLVMAAKAPVPAGPEPLFPCASEVMDEVGVAMRHRYGEADESYLFQKIGFAKDHYEADETAFNWYAKGSPLCMDYGTYTADIAIGAAHNVIDIPDLDSLRRGYLAAHLLTPAADYTHCEMPVTLKLLWGRVRSFAEVDGKDGVVHRDKTPYYYIGDDNPVGPKTWKTRLLLFVKPDYIALFDRVYGAVPHRWCLHTTGTDLRRDGALLKATGRFDLDLEVLVQHPAAFAMETGETVPKLRSGGSEDAARKHSQRWFRVTNPTDGIYRTLLFAREPDRAVTLRPLGRYGMAVETAAYTDYVFLHNEPLAADVPGTVAFRGSTGWIRKRADGTVQAMLIQGDHIAAFGHRFTGRGPWTYNVDEPGRISLRGGPPRRVTHEEGQ